MLFRPQRWARLQAGRVPVICARSITEAGLRW